MSSKQTVGQSGADEAPLAHELAVDGTSRLLAVAHGVRDVRGAGDQVATRVEALTTGLERVAIDLDRAAASLVRLEAVQGNMLIFNTAE